MQIGKGGVMQTYACRSIALITVQTSVSFDLVIRAVAAIYFYDGRSLLEYCGHAVEEVIQ